VKPSASASGEGTNRVVGLTGEKTGEDRHRTHGGARASSAVTTSSQAVAWSWDRGCNGHRILRRVPFRTKAFRIITRRRLSRDGVNGGLGGLRILRPAWRDQKSSCAVTWQHPGSWVRREDESGGRDRDVRGSIASAPWGENAHASSIATRRGRGSALVTIRRSGLGRRETSSPPVMLRGALVSAGRPRRESGEREPGTREMRVHVIRMGGRHRLDASRVFFTWRSQGLLVKEGASPEEVRSTA